MMKLLLPFWLLTGFLFAADAPFTRNPGRIHGDFPLAKAVRTGLPAAVRVALNEGRLNKKVRYHAECLNTYTRTPLMTAVENHFQEAVSILLEAGANPDIKGEQGETALHLAAKTGRENLVRLLLNAGAKADPENHLGQTPLMWAARTGQSQTVTLLLERGANLHHRDFRGRSPRLFAVLGGHVSMIQLLDQFSEPDMQDQIDIQLLLSARSRDARGCLTALANGANPNFYDLDGVTPTHHMAAGDMVHALNLALQTGADPELRDSNGFTALMYAAKTGKRRAVRLLLETGADLDARTGDYRDPMGRPVGHDQTALHLAAKGHHLETYRLLLDAGADADLQNHQGRTAWRLSAGLYPDKTADARKDTTWVDDSITPPNITRKTGICKNARPESTRGYRTLTALFGTDGRISNVRVHQSGDRQADMDEQAAAALKNWRYIPALRNGQPIDFKMTIKMEFH